jgi:hypothetical protein
MLGLVDTVTFLSSRECLLIFYFTLVKLDYTSVICNYITSAGTHPAKFAALCYNRSLPHTSYSYANALQYLKLHGLSERMHCVDALFFINVYLRLKTPPSIFGYHSSMQQEKKKSLYQTKEQGNMDLSKDKF